MSTTKATRVHATRVGPEPRAQSGDELLDRLAWMMDLALRIPGTKIRFGADQVAGLVPVAGDSAAAVIQAAIVLMGMYYYKVPKWVVARMVANILVDLAIGSIPVLGTAFDVYFKVNKRNVDLLRKAAARQAR